MGALGFAASVGLASPPLGWHALEWLGLIPLLWAWAPLGKRASCAAGFAAGVAVEATIFVWLAPAFAAYADASLLVAWLGFALYLVWGGLPFALLGLLDWGFRRQLPCARWWLLPCALAGVEWLWPRVFPWRVGAPQAAAAWVAPLAALTGPIGLTLALGLVSGGLYAAGRRRWLPGAVALATLSGVLAYGAQATIRFQSRASSLGSVRIGWVQPGFVARGSEAGARARVWSALERGCAQVGSQGGADLCVLPEGIIPEAWMELGAEAAGPDLARWERALAHERAQLTQRLRALARAARAPVLAGITRREVAPLTGERLRVLRRTNACVLVGPEGVLAWSGKRRLLPFAEELPFEWLRSLVPNAGRYTAAEGGGLLTLSLKDGSELRVGVLVCYEAIWSRPFPDAPDLLVNPTNDDWFSGRGPVLHAIMARMRSVEVRRPLVRVAPTGVSFAADALGGLQAHARSGAAAGVARLGRPAPGEATPFARYGEGWAGALGALALIVTLSSWRRRRKGGALA